MTGITFGESPRWHDDRLWFSDWGAQEVIAVDREGRSEVIVRTPASPFSIDWLPDGRLLIISGPDGLLLRREPDGSLVTHADLSGLSDHSWNEIVVDGRGNAYVNNIGFDFPAGEFAPGFVALVSPDGSARQVADGLAFPNGICIGPDQESVYLTLSWEHSILRRWIAGPRAGAVETVRSNMAGYPAQIHATADGTIGLTYYDLQNATAAQPGLTDAFIAHCHAATSDCGNPANWAVNGQTRLTATPFDYTTAPDAGGYFLGDYSGLAATGPVLTAYFGVARPVAVSGASDIFANHAG